MADDYEDQERPRRRRSYLGLLGLATAVAGTLYLFGLFDPWLDAQWRMTSPPQETTEAETPAAAPTPAPTPTPPATQERSALASQPASFQPAAESRRVDFEFRGCDYYDRCARFLLYAPGRDYRWALGKTTFETPTDGAPQFVDAVRDILARSEGVIASGLASREGDSVENRRLSACRSKKLAAMLTRAAGGNAEDVYRVALGRYGSSASDRADTSIERLVVMAFILQRDPGVNMSQALKVGLSQELPSLLERLMPDLALQLEFTSYECWRDEFQVTPSDMVRSACYVEPTLAFQSFCGDYE